MLTIGSVKEHTREDNLVHDIQLNVSLIYQELQSLSLNFERSSHLSIQTEKINGRF